MASTDERSISPSGPRPDEPGPPIGGPDSYPPDVVEQLAADAATIIARYPQARSALLPLLHLVQAQDGYLTGPESLSARANWTSPTPR